MRHHVEKPRHHHVHMPHVHMPHVHMPHVHMPHLHNPFHRKTHHDGEYDGEHDDDAHPKKVQRSKTFLQRMTSGMRSSTRASRVQGKRARQGDQPVSRRTLRQRRAGHAGAASSIRSRLRAQARRVQSFEHRRLPTSKRSRRSSFQYHTAFRVRRHSIVFCTVSGTVCTAPRWCARSER